ncbi:MAG: leucine--tRNA ligase [bacterium]|nr:leucine--tRNA ligase [bacterium]
MKKYLPKEIESKWQKTWEEEELYSFDVNDKTSRGKYYTLVELPYPSGDLHIGHWFSFVTPDILSRFKRMSGNNVFFPHGFDAFGLPAENAAIKRKIHPQDWTMKNIETMTNQFKTMGTMIDWNYVTITCLPEYYRWNQWIFLKMYEKGLAYRGKTLSNWCETDQTVLANENIENGKCWRCGNEVVQKEVAQWFLKITEYADRLIWPENPGASPERSRRVDWPMSVRVGQNNWIGKKAGINITYKIKGTNETITCFTTRPDTNFGATFIVLAPEQTFVKSILNKNSEVKAYVEKAEKKSELDRMAEGRKKTGVFTGYYAINNLNGREMSIWVSDFVLAGFGTGAVVGVPGHDLRDFEFATQFGIDIIRVVVGKDGDTSAITDKKQVQEKEGTMINSDFLNDLDIHEATKKVMEYIEKKGWGKKTVTYHIRDWSISRQRYWGTPVPMIHCQKCGIVPVPEKDLPIELPYEVDFTPKGKPPLASNEEWVKTTCPKCSGPATRDAETLDTFFDSSWYFYRYVNPGYTNGPFDTQKVKKLLPVDIYFGGAEHTLGHTLYARFFTKFFKDLGLIDFEEFASKRIQHGVVLGPDGNRMSKSKGNVVNPDDMVSQYGADVVRMYLCFMMPYEAIGPWSTEAIEGMYRFINRVWYLYQNIDKSIKPDKKDLFFMHKTIKKVEQDIPEVKTNTAIAGMMEWLNYLSRKEKISEEEYKTFLTILAPFAPHMTEELWRSEMKEKESIHLQPWPQVEEKYLTEDEVNIPVQVNGKVRGVITVSSADLSQDTVVKKATEDEKVKKYLEGKDFKVVYVQGKILNLIVK